MGIQKTGTKTIVHEQVKRKAGRPRKEKAVVVKVSRNDTAISLLERVVRLLKKQK